MNYPCPNCGVAGPNLNCNLHPMPKFGNMTNPCKEIPLPIVDRVQAQDREKELLAEIGRLSLRLRTAELHAHTMETKILELQAAGIIDQLGRRLPLPDHHRECPHGQVGWAVCTCEELKARDIRNAKSLDGAFDDLMDDDEGPKKCLHGNTECKRCNPARDPRQDLKPGDHVRFEIEGIIKERQSAGILQDYDGNDFEPIQYAIKDSINGKTYYVGYHQITKKIGSVE